MPGTGSQWDMFINKLSAIALTAGLVNFNGVSTKDGNDITWSTTSEKNNKSFTLERSEDGVDFIPLTTISGAGNSAEPKHYSYLDRSFTADKNYYRLLQTDYNGISSFSNTILLKNNLTTVSPSISPNPAQSVVTISFGTYAANATIRIIDINGTLVMEKTAVSGRSTDMNISKFAKGSYFVNVLSDNHTNTLKLSKD